MDPANKTALELLEQLRTERAELEMLIRALEKRLGVIPNNDEGDSAQSNAPRVTVSLDNIPVGFFHNLSQAAAAEKLLRMNDGHPLTSNEIMDAFRKSGMDVSGKNALTILYNALKRSSKFERVAEKAWGLAEWYPEKRKANSRSPRKKHEPRGQAYLDKELRYTPSVSAYALHRERLNAKSLIRIPVKENANQARIRNLPMIWRGIA